jgi:hypothetical protein
VSQRSLTEARYSFLRRYVGMRVNVFRAMYTQDVFLSADRSAVALRDAEYALAARLTFDPACGYFCVSDCHWYRSDLSRIDDEEIPDAVRRNLLDQFLTLIG